VSISNHTPSVLFVCVRNGGKSQMAAALMRHRASQAGAGIDVYSAGTHPGGKSNQLAANVLSEISADMSQEAPKALDDDVLTRVDRVVVVGDEAQVDPIEGMVGTIETWPTDEPSRRGIDGVEQMRLVRDDIDARVQTLLTELTVAPVTRPAVLFVCVHNAGRSQMAAGYLRHLAGDRIDVRSAGTEPADQLNPVAVEAMAEEGVDITETTPAVLSHDAVLASDVVITMGCGDTCPIYPGKRYEDWELDDPAGQDLETVRVIRDDVKARIRYLISELLPADTVTHR